MGKPNTKKKAVPKKKRSKDADYKCSKKCQWTKKDHIGPPSAKKLEQLEKIKKDDKKKGRHHHQSRFDDYTGNSYYVLKQSKYLNICGTRGMGLVAANDLAKGTIGFISEEPGVPMRKIDRAVYKTEFGYHFIGRLLFAMSCHVMKANIISMENGEVAEVSNAKLERYTQAHLNTLGYAVPKHGTYAVIILTEDVRAKDFIRLSGYGNKKDYPYGSSEFLRLEKQVINQYESNLRIKLDAKCARTQVCLDCCELYDNNKQGRAIKHEKECKKNLLLRLWEAKKPQLVDDEESESDEEEEIE